MTRIITALVVLYMLIGLVEAIRWSMEYDPKKNSAPNNAVTFVLNTLFWPL